MRNIKDDSAFLIYGGGGYIFLTEFKWEYNGIWQMSNMVTTKTLPLNYNHELCIHYYHSLICYINVTHVTFFTTMNVLKCIFDTLWFETFLHYKAVYENANVRSIAKNIFRRINFISPSYLKTIYALCPYISNPCSLLILCSKNLLNLLHFFIFLLLIHSDSARFTF